MHRIALGLIFGLAAACWPPPVAAQFAPSERCATTEFDGVLRLADDLKGRRYLVRFREEGRPMSDSRTLGLDTPERCTNADCVGTIFGVILDTNNVIVRIVDPAGPFAGTITAYGADRTWTGKIGRSALVDLPYGGSEASITVRADGPIEGIEYAPTWAPCTFRAGLFPRGHFETPDLQRPTLILGDSQQATRPSCAHPYVLPAVTHAVEPRMPELGENGTVRVAVALDARGRVQSARVLSSPSVTLNASAVSAATHSEYTPGIVRCAAVPSAYPFGVQYNI